MNRLCLYSILLVLTVSGPVARAAGGDFDLGIIIGDPTGISAKKWLDATHAIDLGAGWKTGSDDESTLQVDYLVHDFTIFSDRKWPTLLYYGIGARTHDRDNRRRRDGIRLPVGVEVQTVAPALILFGEIVPRLDVSPDTEFHVDAAFGFRYRFSAGGK